MGKWEESRKILKCKGDFVMKKFYQIVCALVVGALLLLSVIGCDNTTPEQQILSYLQQGNYDEAFSILAYAMQENTLDEDYFEDFRSVLEEQINDVFVEYLNERIDFDSAMESLFEIAMLELIPGVSITIANTRRDIQDLQTSRSFFEAGQYNLARGNYLEAVSAWARVIESDPNYHTVARNIEEAITAHRNNILANADNLARDGDFNGAIRLLQLEISRMPDAQNSQLEARIRHYEDEQYSIRISQILREAEGHAVLNDFSQAILVLEGGSREFERDVLNRLGGQINERLAEYRETLIDNTLTRARAAREEEDFLVAVMLIENAQEIVSSPLLDAELAEINAIRPMTLLEITISQSTRLSYVGASRILRDTIGNTYSFRNLYTFNSRWGYTGRAHIFTNFQYQNMTGTLAVADNSRAAANPTFAVFGDDELIFQTRLNRLTPPIELDIDISRVSWLEIRLTQDGGGWNDRRDLYAILADFQFHR